MVTITLTPELEPVIADRARSMGTTPEIVALDTLNREFIPAAQPAPTGGTLADFLGDFIGCLDSGEIVPGGANMSENIGETFAEGMAEKRGAGRT